VKPTQLRTFAWISWGVCLLVGFILGLRQLHEQDTWWMLASGEWISTTGSFLKQDVFSFTFSGARWVNVKWLFEWLLYQFAALGGPEILPLLQGVINVGILFFMFKLYGTFRRKFINDQPPFPSVAFLLAAYIFLLTAEFRFVGRPEMISHFFTILYVYLFVRHFEIKDKWIYVLIPLQVLWSNLHEGYVIGLVITGVLIFGQAATVGYKKLSKTLKWSFVGVMVAPLCHPEGINMWLQPFVLYANMKKLALFNEFLTAGDALFWQLSTFLFVLVFGLFLWVTGSKVLSQEKKNQRLRRIKKLGWGYFLLNLFFFYFGLSGQRNVPFSLMIALPLVAVGVEALMTNFSDQFRKWGAVVMLVFGVGAYISIPTGVYYKHFNPHEKYGLKIDEQSNPVGAAKFIQQQKLKGNCFSDFIVSSYLLWELRPGFKTFIDLRDFDIYSEAFYNRFKRLLYDPRDFEVLDRQYAFNYVVLFAQPQLANLHQYLYAHQQWTLVFADPMTLIFVRNNEVNKRTIEQHAFRSTSAQFYRSLEKPSISFYARAISGFFWPWYREENRMDQFSRELFFYQTLGLNKNVLALSEKTVNNADATSGEQHCLLGDSYYSLAMETKDNQAKKELLGQSIDAYTICLEHEPGKIKALNGLGYSMFHIGQFEQALLHFEEAIDNGKDMESYMGALITLDSLANKVERVKEIEVILLEMNRLDPNNLYINYRLVENYCNRGECGKAEPYYRKIAQNAALLPHETIVLKRCVKRCNYRLR
jgi:tetratricopeptide (TPR) repeat protein